MTNKIPFDDKAHSILTELLDNTEDWLVRRKLSEPRSANDRLCSDYIMTVSNIIWGSTFFVNSDERIGTEIYLEKLRGAKTKLRLPRTLRACADQMLRFPQMYFPKYLAVLRITYLSALPKLDDNSLLKLSGVVKLAAANLPGVRNDIRRELRRRGQDYDSVIVHDDTLECKLSRFSASLLPMTLDRTETEAD